MPTTTMDRLIGQFARSLRALTPIFDEEGLTWRDGQEYDQFEDISDALFRNIVLDCIEYDLRLGKALRKTLRYGLTYDDYDNRSYIGSASHRTDHRKFAMTSLGTTDFPFDTVKGVSLNSPSDQVHGALPLDGARFWIRL